MARSPNVRMPGEAPASAAADPVEVADAGGPASASADDGLPDASTIDPRTLRKAIQTKQGWLCPAPPPDDGQQRRQGFAI